jgi:hypothetical protein
MIEKCELLCYNTYATERHSSFAQGVLPRRLAKTGVQVSSSKSLPHDANPPSKPWAQQPGEPNNWYGRFQVYLDIGPTRTIAAAARRVGEMRRNKPLYYNGQWSGQARYWRWRERARAWDLYQRELLAVSERNTRLALHERRVEVIEDYLEDVREVLDNAKMIEADQQQARQWLPQMRQFLLGLLAAERKEFERSDDENDDPDNAPGITADDLRAAQRELEAQNGIYEPVHTGTPEGPQTPPDSPSLYLSERVRHRTLFVFVGCDDALRIDLAALRAVRTATDLNFMRVMNTTRRKFELTLRRERNLSRPIELVHLAVHASEDGIQFVDGLADGNWLSERLGGVRVMLLACCEGDSVGEWLGVVPYVVSLSEQISHEDAATLTQHFWHNIGMKLEPGEALDRALVHCPPAISEYVIRHW